MIIQKTLKLITSIIFFKILKNGIHIVTKECWFEPPY